MALSGGRKTAGLLLLAAALLMGTGCSTYIGYAGMEYSWGGKGELSGKYKYLNGTKKYEIGTDAGETLVLKYDSHVEKGSMTLGFTDPEGVETPLEPETSGTLELKSPGGTYKVWVKGKSTRGSFSYTWKVEK